MANPYLPSAVVKIFDFEDRVSIFPKDMAIVDILGCLWAHISVNNEVSYAKVYMPEFDSLSFIKISTK